MEFPNLPLPTSESKQMKYLRKMRLKQLHRLRKELQAKDVPMASAYARNKFLYSQELNNLNNEMMVLDRLYGRGPKPYYNIDRIKSRQEELTKINFYINIYNK